MLEDKGGSDIPAASRCYSLDQRGFQKELLIRPVEKGVGRKHLSLKAHLRWIQSLSYGT